MVQNTCELRLGRLLEIRVGKGYETPEDVDEMIKMIRGQVEKLPAEQRHVTAADWRACTVMSQSASERALQMFFGTNPRTERSAVLYSDQSPTAVMQFLRLVAASENPNRRAFSDPFEMMTWLTEALSAPESIRLREFLGTAP